MVVRRRGPQIPGCDAEMVESLCDEVGVQSVSFHIHIVQGVTS